jgi:hypothetical protein
VTPAPIIAEGTELGNGWRRLMMYYKPTIIMAGMMFNSIINAVIWPLMGYLNTKIMFSVIEMTYDVEKGRAELFYYL